MKLIVKLSLSWAIVFAVILGIEEIVLRVDYASTREYLDQRYQGRDRVTQTSEDPVLIYQGIPNKGANNSFGFPDFEYPTEKPAETFRAVVIADSVGVGQGVRRCQGFAKILEKNLNRDSSTKNAEVMIAGYSGYSTNQQIRLLETIVPKMNPDLVIWNYTLNDPAEPLYHNANGELGLYFYNPTSHVLSYIDRKIFQAREYFYRNKCDQEFPIWLHCAYWGEIEGNFAKIARITNENNWPVVLAINAQLVQFDNYPYMKIHQDLRELGAYHGFQVIDFYEALRNEEFSSLRQSKEDQVHPNKRGHRLMGRYLYQEIKTRYDVFAKSKVSAQLAAGLTADRELSSASGSHR